MRTKTNNNTKPPTARQKLLFRLSRTKASNRRTDSEIDHVFRTLTHMRLNARAAKKRAAADAQWASRALTDFTRLVKKGALV